MLFTFKKMAAMLFMPLPLVIILLLIGLVLLYRNKRRSGFTFSGLAVLLLLLLSTPWIPDSLMGGLEQQYHQYDLSVPVKTVVVMGCGHFNDGRLPLTAQLKPCSLYRLVEGIRIMRQNPGSILITSGYSTEPVSNAEEVKRVAIALGVNPQRIRTQGRSKDTEQEVLALKPMIGHQPFALVTSANHMVRCVHLFKRAGLHPVPAPAEYFVKQANTPARWYNQLPDARNIRKFELYWYETMGNLWLWIRGK